MRKNHNIKRDRIIKKFSSCYTIALLLFATLIVMMQVVKAEGPIGDVITTYVENGSLQETSEFNDGETVIVNASMDNITNDPTDQPYWMVAQNNDTGDWVRFPVSDNESYLMVISNTASDGKYWGYFNLSSVEESTNASMGVDAILQIADGDMVYIYEHSSGLWDCDPEVADKEIMISFTGGGNDPPEIFENSDSSGYTNTSYTFNVSVYDNDGVDTVWVDYNYNSTHYNESMSNVGDNYYEYQLIWEGVEELVSFTIATNDTNNNWNSTTDQVEISDPGGENHPPNKPGNEVPPNGSTDRLITTTLSWSCNDPDSDDITFDVYFDNSNPPAQQESNQTSTSYDPGTLNNDETYYWYIVAWDEHGLSNTSEYWWFTTEDVGGGGEGTSSISGYVLEDESHEGIDSATVEIFDNSSGYYSDTITDGDGYYNFSNLNASTYDIKTYKNTVFPEIWNSSINLGEDQHIVNSNFLVSTGSGGGDIPVDNITVVGYVFQENTNEEPIENCNVIVNTYGNENDILNTTTTNEEGFFMITFLPNQTAVNQGNQDIQFTFEADNYESDSFNEGIQHMMSNQNDEGIFVIHDAFLNKIYGVDGYAYGNVYLKDTTTPIENATVIVENEQTRFQNYTYTDDSGYFIIGINITQDNTEFEFFVNKDGYFVNVTEEMVNISESKDIGVIEIEIKPSSDYFVSGNLTSGGSGIANTNLILYDRDHPFESEKGFFDLPTTDSNGFFNISTYPGNFSLITLARIIGETREGPPLGIGGYQNDVVNITINPNSLDENNASWVDINLDSADPDEIIVNLNITNCTTATATMKRTVSANPKIVRAMTDADYDGTISSDEALNIISFINSSLTQSGYFDAESLFLRIPFEEFKFDDVALRPFLTSVEIDGLMGETFIEDSMTIYINETLTASSEIDNSSEVHSVMFKGYYCNPAFEIDYTIETPTEYNIRNYKSWMLNVNQIDSTTINVVPVSDPDWNDTDFFSYYYMAIGTQDPFAEFYNDYYSETPYDTDSDGDYDSLICKIKFDTNESGTFTVDGKVYSPTGILITETSGKSTYSAGRNTVELKFDGEEIYRKKYNGPYYLVYDLFNDRNNTDIWFSYMNKTTNSYTYDQFTQPDIYFTGTIEDSGLDTDDDGLYNYLQLSILVDVGETGYYQFEGDIGTCDFSYQGDPRITGIQQGITYVDTGEQWANLTFDGGAIYEKGCNSSIWVNMRVRTSSSGNLDEINTMTEKYYYTDFNPPPPENSTIYGNITDVYGYPVNAMVRIRDKTTNTENTTETNSSTGAFNINCREGTYDLEVNPYMGSYEHFHEVVVISEDEMFNRDITLLPPWHQCTWMNQDIDSQQYATGDDIYVNVTQWSMPYSNCTLEAFREHRDGDEYNGEEFISSQTGVSDADGRYSFLVDTSTFTNGMYVFKMWMENETSQIVARGDFWGIQISSLQLDFDIDKNNYRPSGTGIGTYTLTYISNGTEVDGSSYEWKILNWDWMGEHVLASGTFIDEISGNGTFEFTVPSNADNNDWYDIRLTATDSDGNEVQSWRSFGITTGSIIESVTDSPFGGSQGSYQYILMNVTVNVTTSKEYRINCGLHDSNWNWITYNETTSSLSSGENNILVYLNGEEINDAGYDGYYKAWIGLYPSDNWWNELDSVDYTTTNTYNASDFIGPTVRFEDGILDYTINSPSGYEALIVNCSINASEEGCYSVHADLRKENSNDGGIQITWNQSEIIDVLEGGPNDTNTSLIVPIRFEGSDIYNSGQNGPYRVHLHLHCVYGNNHEFVTSYHPETDLNYDYDDFAKPAAIIETVTDNGSFSGNLEISININVSDGNEGDYEIFGHLQSSDWDYITHAQEFVELGTGTTNIELTFSGASIYSSGKNGPYRLHISLSKQNPWENLGHSDFWTNSHLYTDFTTPGGMFNGTYTDMGYDEDNDGYYNYLRILTPIDISNTGNYNIYGNLYYESNNYRNDITWGYTDIQVTETGTIDATIDFNGFEIRNAGYNGYYSVELWLHANGQDGHLDEFEFTTDNYYYANDFQLPSVRFVNNETTPNDSNDSEYINVNVRINSSEIGTYYVRGNLFKQVQSGGGNYRHHITDVQNDVYISTLGETDLTLSYDIGVVQASGYNGPYYIDFELRDSSWQILDTLTDYQTESYDFSGMGDLRSVYFTEEYDDYVTSDGGFLVLNATLQVNDTGYYSIGGSLQKEGYYISGSWTNSQYMASSPSPQIMQIHYDSAEVLNGIEGLPQDIQDDFASGTTFDFELWIFKSGGDSGLDQLTEVTNHSYSTSDFSTGAGIEQVSDEGYNESGDEGFEYLNVSVTLNFTDDANYQIWADIGKQSGYDYTPLGWKNTFVTITSTDIIDGYEEETVILQFEAEQISSSEINGPYSLHVEVQNLDLGRRVALYEDYTNNYNATDFVSTTVYFDEINATAEGEDTDGDGDYNYLTFTANVTADSDYNIELRGDLKKISGNNHYWISWANEWSTLSTGINTVSLQFNGEIISGSGYNGPYSVRIELWDTDNWKLLDSIESVETNAYSYDNFETPSASINTSDISDSGHDTNSDGFYEYLEVNVSISVGSEDYYELNGDLYTDTYGWNWIDWTNSNTYLSEGENTITLQFDGISIRNKAINGPYKVRLELRDSDSRTIDSYEPYSTSTYTYTDFQTSGATIEDVTDRKTDAGDLEVNITVNCSTNAEGNYWIGCDLHKQSGWNWDWIAWESNNGNNYIDGGEETTITILFSGETIYNSGINGPYHIRVELRDVSTWTEQDSEDPYTTSGYTYTEFRNPSVSFIEDTITDWGNDSDDTDSYYDYLEINVTINCTQTGTFWLQGDLQKRTGYNWNWISWEGQEITIEEIGDQTVKLQFDGERIYDSATNGPYSIRLEIKNTTTWAQIDSVDPHTTGSYSYTDFQRPSVEFIEDDNSPNDYGEGTLSSYSNLVVTVQVNSSTPGTYWLNANLHKQISGGPWQHIAWEGEAITHNGSGIENYTIRFDGSNIRNKRINGPYQVRLELNSYSGEWKQYDIIEQYTTNSYNATDFISAGVELVEQNTGTADQISSGNLLVNVTVNSTTSGRYRIEGDLHKDSGYNWQWISWNSTEVEIDTSGEQTFSLLFEGSEIYESQINGPYHIRIELRKVGTNNLIDTIEQYTTDDYNYINFSRPTASINSTSDCIINGNLQVNVSTYSASDIIYQFSGWLYGENWEYIAWDDNITSVSDEEVIDLGFDGSIINNSGINPAKVYIEMRRTSDNKLMDYETFNLNNTYSTSYFGASVSIDDVTLGGLPDNDNDSQYDSLNISVNITFSTADYYEISAGLVDQNGTWITGKNIPSTYYPVEDTVFINFDGLKIYMKGLDGPYTISFISIVKQGVGEVARSTNAFVTSAYDSGDFEHPDGITEDGTIEGNYSSYALDSDDDGDYDYLVINITVNVTEESDDYDIYGDLYSSTGATWIAGDYNYSSWNNGTWDGEETVQLYFEGDDIYSSSTDGPYLLGYIRLGAYVGSDENETWVLLDEANSVYTTSSYNYSEFENESVSPLVPSGITSISDSNDPFSPNSDGTYDTTLVTVAATTGQTLYLNIYNSSNVIKRTGLQMNEVSSGTYTATWNGKNDNEFVVSDGTFTIKVSDDGTGNQANESGDQAETVVVDTQAPTGTSVEINSRDTYVNTTSVNLTTITANDNSSIKMRFKNAGGDWTDWEDFQSSKSWTLNSTDGTRTVYYQAKDVAGNIAPSNSDSIILDTTKPSSVNITITGDGDTPSTHSNDVGITLTINAEDSTSGVEYMMISNDITFSGRSWVDYATSKDWTLTSGDGIKTVYIKVKDRAGKLSDIYSDNITLDTVAPTNTDISINSGNDVTNTTNVTLTLTATGATKMRLKNSDGSWSSWETYATTKSGWTISSGSGTKTVIFQAKDKAGNIAENATDTIILDTTAPTITGLGSSGVTQTSATISWGTNEVATTQVEYGQTISYGSTTTLNSTLVGTHSQTITGLTAGTTYHYRVKSRDAAGNLANSVDRNFTTNSGADTTPPNPIEGLTVTDKSNAESTLSLSWNESDDSGFASYKIYRKTSSFTNVTTSGVSLIATIDEKTTTTYDDTTATDDTEFYYAVTAIDSASPPNENKTISTQNIASGTSVDDKAPTTTDNIPAGWQTSAVTVTLTASDGGKGVNYTIYTTDGSDPTNVSNQNRTATQINDATGTVTFSVGGDNALPDGQYTIKYYSYDKNTSQNNESIHTDSLWVDTETPYTIDNAPSGWQNTTVTVSLNATDNTSQVYKTYYTKNGSTPTVSSTQYSSPILFTTQGTRTLKYFSKDYAGKSESVLTTYIYIDLTNPSSSITALSSYSSIPFDVSWTSSDTHSGISNIEIQYRNGSGGAWTTWFTDTNASGTQSFTNGSSGNTYYFRSIATDNASNTEYVTTYDAFTTVVAGALNVSISSPTDSDGDGEIHLKSNVTITGTASGPDFTKYWLNYSADNGTSWVNIANSTSVVTNSVLGYWNTTNLNMTPVYTLNLTVINSSGASNTYTLENVYVDNAAPNITSISSDVTSSSATITWTTNESANSTVEYGLTTLFGSTATVSGYTTSHSVEISGLSESTTYYYRVISYDKAGNMQNSSNLSFTTSASEGSIPGGPGGGPSISPVTADAGGPYTGYVGVAITFDGSGSSSTGGDITGYKWDWDNDGTWDTDYLTSETTTHSFSAVGEYTITLKVIDENSETDEDTATVTVSEIDDGEDEDENDNAPTISDLSHSPTKVTTEDIVTIAAIVNDDVGLVSVTLVYNDGTEKTETMTASGSRYTAMIGPFTSVGTTVIYYVQVVDTASQTTTSSTNSFTIKEPPITEEVGNIQEGQTAEVPVENSDISGVKIKSTSSLSNVKITIEKLDPEEIDEVPSETEDITIYSYIELKLTSENITVSEDDLEEITIEFKVPLIWINENNIDVNTITMMRYHNGQWSQLPTTYLEGQDDGTYAYFEAITTGTSTFAIVGSEVIEIEEEPEPESEMPWFIIIGVVVMIIFILIGFMFKAGFLYIERQDEEEINQDATSKKKTNNQNNKKK